MHYDIKRYAPVLRTFGTKSDIRMTEHREVMTLCAVFLTLDLILSYD